MSMALAQRLAAQAVAEVAAGRNLSDVLAAVWQQYPQLGTAEKGALQDMTYGCLRQRGLFEQLLCQMMKKPPVQPLYSLLLVALYQLYATRNAAYAVVNEAVNNAAKLGGSRHKSLVNAVLRRFMRERESLLQAALKHDAARHNLPAWWTAYLKRHYPAHGHNIISAFQTRPPMTLRINRRRSDAAAYLLRLQGVGLDGDILGDYAVRLQQPVTVSQLPGFAEGDVSVQDWGAQQAVPLLDVRDGERVLDACAAPGGKSGHLLEWAACDLTAIDVDEQRLSRVTDNLSRLGLRADVRVADAQQLMTWYDGRQFDAVLADVPCTASGVVRRHPDIKWLRQPQDAAKTAAQQAPLLGALWQTVRPGGRLLLATCSLFEEENQQQLAAFLHRHADARCRSEHVLLPNGKQDGFYYALIDKT